MNVKKQSIAVLIMVLFLLATAVPALAINTWPIPLGTPVAWASSFGGCSQNNPTNVAYGEANLRVEVYPWDTPAVPSGNAQVMFVIYNLSPAPVPPDNGLFVIKSVYFDDGALLNISTPYDADQPTGNNQLPGVDFTLDPTGSDTLPSPNCVTPPWGNLANYAMDADPAPPQKGINGGEYLGVLWELDPGMTITELVAGLNSGAVRIGVHAIAFPDGGSESFVTNNATAIKLDSFNAGASRGRVSLNWRTGTEVNNAGFNLYRSSTASESRAKVNGGIIAAKGEAVSGATYSFMDAPGYGTYYYWLEDVEFTGKATLHGPIKVTVVPSLGLPLYRPVLPGAR